MLADIPQHIYDILALKASTPRALELKHKLLWSAVQRHGFRWEYFHVDT